MHTEMTLCVNLSKRRGIHLWESCGRISTLPADSQAIHRHPVIKLRSLHKLLTCLLIQIATVSVGFSQSVAVLPHTDYFAGSIIVQWIEHDGPDRDMQLMNDFSYIDPNGKEWKVPTGAIIDGASIPQALWSFVGSPFVGDYRRASVVHDYFCDNKSERSEDVHRMFYHAARAGGVADSFAKRMYGALVYAGPKWELIQIRAFDGTIETIPEPLPTPIVSEEQLAQIAAWIESASPTLDQIDLYVKRRLSSLRR